MLEILSEIILELVRLNFFDGFELVVSILTLIVLFLTYKWVKKYTIISDTQTNELIKQRLLMSLPSLSTSLSKLKTVPCTNSEPIISAHFIFKNIGNGIANNIILKPISFEKEKDIIFTKPQQSLAGIMMRQDETKEVTVYFSSSEPTKIPHDKQIPEEKIKRDTIIISLWFQDVAGNIFQQDNKIVNGNYFQGTPIPKTLEEFQSLKSKSS